MPDSAGEIGRKTARASAGLVIRTVVGQATSFIALLVLSKLLGAADYALYAVVILIISAATSMVTLPVTMILVRTPTAPPISTINAATTFCAVILGAIGLIATIITIVVETQFAPIGLAGTVYGVLTATTIPSTVLLQRNLQAARASLISLANQVTLQVIMALSVAIGVTSLSIALILALLLSSLCAAITAQLLARWRLDLAALSHAKPLLGAASGAFMIGLVNLLMSGGLTLAMTILVSARDAGYFAWAFTIAIAAQGLFSLFDTALIPALSLATDVTRSSAYALVSRLLTVLAIVVHLGVILVVPLLIGPVFPAHWVHALPSLYCLSFGNVLAAYTLPAHSLWYSQIGTVSLALRYWLASTVSAASLLLFVPSFGATGGALAFVLYQIATAALLRVGIRHLVSPQPIPLMWIGFTATATLIIGTLITQGHEHSTEFIAVTLTTLVTVILALDRGRILNDLRDLFRRIFVK